MQSREELGDGDDDGSGAQVDRLLPAPPYALLQNKSLATADAAAADTVSDRIMWSTPSLPEVTRGLTQTP